MNLTLIKLLFISFILFGCNNDEFYIISNNGGGLKKESEVLCKGVSIGKIKDVKIINNEVLITVSINSESKIPTNSKIGIGTKNLVDKILIIDYNKSNSEYVLTGDTLRLNISYYKTLKIKDGYFQDILK